MHLISDRTQKPQGLIRPPHHLSSANHRPRFYDFEHFVLVLGEVGRAIRKKDLLVLCICRSLAVGIDCSRSIADLLELEHSSCCSHDHCFGSRIELQLLDQHVALDL